MVPVRSARGPAATRGPVAQAIKAFLIKVAEKSVDGIASLVLSKLVAQFEKASWKRRGLREGWLEVTKDTLAARKLEAGRPSSADRSLLLIHGTFSNAASAYRALAESTFFERVRGLYGNRIYAFDHFTLSRTPEENARMLLEGLPDETFTFDVITHSRGGLVLRTLAERSTAFGRLAKRFELGRAVLVASPNEGTPLATPERWEDTVGWMANLLELFPDNPFTLGAEFVAHGIVWIARHASGGVPGLHSMDGDGDLIAELQQPPGPPPESYSALVANYDPKDEVLKRMVDTGVDQFFASANDLVVPSEGGWRIDRGGSSFIPGTRIGCFGPGGNLHADSVTHIAFFSQPAAVDFLVTALAGKEQPLAPVDPARSLPDRRLLRSGGAGVSAPTTSFGRRTPAARRDRLGRGARAIAATERSDGSAPSLRLTVVNGDLTFERLPLLIGHYNATKLTGAERVMNTLIGGAMSQALDLGDYPIEPGSHQIFLNRRIVQGKPWLTPRPKAVIVVGLGQEASLNGADLARTVRHAVIAWARHVVEEHPSEAGGDAPAPPAPLEMAATLIASGGSGVTAGQAAQLIAQGVYEANERLGAASSRRDRRLPWVGHLRLVELYLDRASEAWRALKMHEAATPERYVLDKFIERGTGPLPRPLDAGYRGAEYDFITAETRITPTGEVEDRLCPRHQAVAHRDQDRFAQGRLVRDLVKTASSDANDDPRIATTLFKLLIPVDLESFLTGSTDMQIELDAGTAGIPWELLDDVDEKKSESKPWAIRTKLLRKLRLQDFRRSVGDAEGDAYALVIGAPECPDDFPPVPGAREEALAVFESLSGSDVFGSRAIRLIGADPSAAGADARTVVNTLLERPWRLVHIAGHGALPEGDEAIGGVVLSNGTFLGPAEIQAMRVVPELVFINCCHLGAMPIASVLDEGRGSSSVYDRARFASGVARELIAIGVRCVIAAGWAVDDVAAKAFASTFYARLLAGERFIDAVAEARSVAYDYDSNTPHISATGIRIGESGETEPKHPLSSEHEFEGVTSVATLKLALETLLVQKTYQGHASAEVPKRARMLEERWRDAAWSASDGVAELFARVHAAVGDLDAAIAWYDRAIGVADGSVSMRALEQRANLLVRRAWSTLEAARPRAGATGDTGKKGKKGRRSAAPASAPDSALKAARATIEEGVEVLGRLREFRPTAERANLCGSAMKRLALIEAAAGRPREELQAIEKMKQYYGEGQRLCVQDRLPDLFYPASNYIAAELALNAGRQGWKLADRSLFEAARQSLRDKNRDDPDFWSIVGEIDLDLYAAVAAGELAEGRKSLEDRYQDLYTRMRGGSDWGSVYDTAVFVLDKYRERAEESERRASDAILARLEALVTPPRAAERKRAPREPARS